MLLFFLNVNKVTYIRMPVSVSCIAMHQKHWRDVIPWIPE